MRKKMNSRERIFTLFKGGHTDHLPLMPITMQLASDSIGKKYKEYATDHRILVAGQLKIAEDFDFDHVSVISDPAREAADCGASILYSADSPEYKQGVVTGITEMTVVSRAFLSSKSRTVRTVDVQNNLFDMFVFVNFIDPVTGLVHQGFQVLGSRENLGLKSSHQDDRSGCFIFCPFTDNMTHGKINR
ncbi:MAG: hypothetical protein JSW66_06790 [Phycisphaerales bacterium]|nr:MAG: hypothetical protein JSW66_06790 [Phycisphaerales bacterium]